MKNKGNVLFLILIAVALFAALAYAVTKSTSGGSGNTKKENTSLQAAQIVQHMTQIENAIAKMKMINGCADHEINFSNALDGTRYDNPNAPADGRCDVFSPKGGGVSRVTFNVPEKYENMYYTRPGFAAIQVLTNVGKDCYNASCSEFIASMRVQEHDLCKELNVAEGNPEWKDGVEMTSFIMMPNNSDAFTGTIIAALFNAEPGFEGKLGACYRLNTPSDEIYIYYHVILAR